MLDASCGSKSMATINVPGDVSLLGIRFLQCTIQRIENVMLTMPATNTNNDDDCNKMNGLSLTQAIDAWKLLEQGECGPFEDHKNNPLDRCLTIGAYALYTNVIQWKAYECHLH